MRNRATIRGPQHLATAIVHQHHPTPFGSLPIDRGACLTVELVLRLDAGDNGAHAHFDVAPANVVDARAGAGSHARIDARAVKDLHPTAQCTRAAV